MTPRFAEFFQNHPQLILGFLALAGGLIWTLLAGRSPGVVRVNPNDATRLINSEDAVVLDVRADAEYRNGHIINAINVPRAQLDTQLDALEKYKSRPIITVCSNGQDSARVGVALKKKGFDQVHILTGGLQTWETANLPLAK
jgi:rhodanese-related sulfurtransferase